MTREVVLVYSRSELARDERVQKQIRLCAANYDVVSVGLGPYDGPVARHIDLRELSPPPAQKVSAAKAALPVSPDHGSNGNAAESGSGISVGGVESVPSAPRMLIQVIRREGLLIAALRVLRKLVPSLDFTTKAIDSITADRRQKKIELNERKKIELNERKKMMAAAERKRRDERLAAYKMMAAAERKRRDERLAAHKMMAAAERKRRDERLAAHRKLQIEKLANLRSRMTSLGSENQPGQDAIGKLRDPVTDKLEAINNDEMDPPFPSILWCTDFEAGREGVPRTDWAFFEEVREELAKSEQLELEKRHAPIIKALAEIDFSLAIANDITSINVVVPLAKQKQVKVIYDAHEFSPGQRVLTEETAWALYLAAFKLGKYLPLCDEVLTACDSSSDEHVRWFNIRRPTTITNAPNYVDLAPVPLDGNRVRLVHHGVATRPRELEKMIDTVMLLDERFSLDFYVLTPDSAYFEELKARCSGNARVRFLPTVPSSKIAESINCYDIGFYILPPVNFNQKFALPNKFFEFVQARLAVAIAPSPEMASYARKYDLGVVARDFTPLAMAEALNGITPEALWRFKTNSHQHAAELSAAPQMRRLDEVVERAMSKRGIPA